MPRDVGVKAGGEPERNHESSERHQQRDDANGLVLIARQKQRQQETGQRQRQQQIGRIHRATFDRSPARPARLMNTISMIEPNTTQAA